MTTAVSRPPLVRGSDRVIAGVCAGLARHLGWPVRMVRLGMAVAALAGGAGVAFYAWLWIMVPTADESAKRNARQPASPIAPAVSAPFAAPLAEPYAAAPRRQPRSRHRPAAGPATTGAAAGAAALRRRGRFLPIPGGAGSPACATARKFCSGRVCCWPPAS